MCAAGGTRRCQPSRSTSDARLGWHRLVPPAAHMLLRELQRQPLRVLASCFALAAATALNVVDGYYYDGIEALVYSQFHERMREDVSVTFGSAVPTRALRGLGQLPGVLSVEGLRVVPMRIHANHRHRDAVIWGYSDRGQMRQPRNSEGQLIPLPPTGIVLTDILASILKVRVGDTIEVELREGRRERRQIVVTGFMSEPFGLAGHMRADALHAWLGESPRVSMALLRVDPQQAAIVDQRLKDLPSILEVNKVQSILQKWREQSGSMILTMAFVIALFAATITVGVVYNNARVALSMRGRDLATLRVLGFSRREVSMLLMGEQLIQVALSLPFGLLLGNLLVQLLASMTDPESYRIPVSLTPRSYVIGVIITLGSALLSGLLVLRLLNRLDLIAVLKARE
ncbi:MAG: ABC transporter permease [Elusimicrobia bacterium]|nr:MAG: ABC transporter permease [Elusimicrobiota bacterium]